METIKSYLETMFANMPNTPEVLRASTDTKKAGNS